MDSLTEEDIERVSSQIDLKNIEDIESLHDVLVQKGFAANSLWAWEKKLTDKWMKSRIEDISEKKPEYARIPTEEYKKSVAAFEAAPTQKAAPSALSRLSARARKFFASLKWW